MNLPPRRCVLDSIQIESCKQGNCTTVTCRRFWYTIMCAACTVDFQSQKICSFQVVGLMLLLLLTTEKPQQTTLPEKHWPGTDTIPRNLAPPDVHRRHQEIRSPGVQCPMLVPAGSDSLARHQGSFLDCRSFPAVHIHSPTTALQVDPQTRSCTSPQ